MKEKIYPSEKSKDAQARALVIAGRPRAGQGEAYLLLEDLQKPVEIHWCEEYYRHMPHLEPRCPYCDGTKRTSPTWYVGALCLGEIRRLVIVEISEDCCLMLQRALREGSAAGREVAIYRANYPKSPRRLRVLGPKIGHPEWTYNTRRELARIWGVPLRPQLRIVGEVG